MLFRLINFLQRRVSDFIYIYRRKKFIKSLKYCGKNLEVRFPVVLEGSEYISLGDDVSIVSFVHMWGHGGIEIGNRVMIATHTTITTLTHDYSKESMRFSEIIAKKVIIEDDVWIGSNAVIMPGVTIKKGAVVGACALITKDVPEYAIVGGIPAKVFKYRYFNGK